MWIKIFNLLSELLFPSFCLGCHREGVLLCQDCIATLDINEYTYCLCSNHPIRIPYGSIHDTCGRCRNKKLSGLYVALPYKEKVLTKKLIYQFKYAPYIKNLAKPLAIIILHHLVLAHKNTENIFENSILVPVPLYKSKLKYRGYNQSEELARELSKTLLLPVITNSLVKIKKTTAQMELSAKDRQENVKNAFLVKNIDEVKGKKVFLLDDVYTTGATMEECARVLRAAGATKVVGITIAREG